MKGAAEHEGRGNQPESAALLRALDAGLSPELLERALTHRSFAYENGGLPTNERLEFLGDAVLGLIVTDALFREYPDLPEGHLAKLRAAVVNMRALAEVARGLHLGGYVRLGRGEEGTGGRDKSSILADTLEAVIGAVYIERGLAQAGALVHRLFDPVIAQSARLGAGLDWKTSLQELTAAGVLGVPEYHVTRAVPTTRNPSARWSGWAGASTARGRAAPRRKPSSRRPRPPGARSARGTAGRGAKPGRRATAGAAPAGTARMSGERPAQGAIARAATARAAGRVARTGNPGAGTTAGRPARRAMAPARIRPRWDMP